MISHQLSQRTSAPNTSRDSLAAVPNGNKLQRYGDAGRPIGPVPCDRETMQNLMASSSKVWLTTATPVPVDQTTLLLISGSRVAAIEPLSKTVTVPVLSDTTIATAAVLRVIPAADR